MQTQIITPEQAKALRLLPFGKKHSIRALLEAMQVGQLLQIARDDFRWKRKTPNILCRDIEKKTGKKFKMLKEHNKQSWVVERVA